MAQFPLTWVGGGKDLPPPNKNFLVKTRSSYLTQDAISSKKSKSLLGWFHIILVGWVIALYIGLRAGSVAILELEGLLFGPLFLINGWFEFSLLQTVEDIPTAKIGSSAEGLNELNGSFVSDSGSLLTSPITKQKCVYYQIDLQYYYSSKNSSGYITVASYGYGLPALLSDDTGYMAIDLADADLDYVTEGRWFLEDKSGDYVKMGEQTGKSVITYVNTCKDDCDISSLGLSADTSGSRLKDASFKDTLFGGNALYIVESIIPSASTFFAMGRVKTAEKMIKSKPVKMLTYDPGSKLFSVREESKEKIVSQDKTYTYLSFGLGFILFMVGLYGLSTILHI